MKQFSSVSIVGMERLPPPSPERDVMKKPLLPFTVAGLVLGRGGERPFGYRSISFLSNKVSMWTVIGGRSPSLANQLKVWLGLQSKGSIDGTRTKGAPQKKLNKYSSWLLLLTTKNKSKTWSNGERDHWNIYDFYTICKTYDFSAICKTPHKSLICQNY